MTDTLLPTSWTSIATRTMSGRQEWELLPRSPLTLEQVEIEVSAGRLEKRVQSYGKLDVLGVKAR